MTQVIIIAIIVFVSFLTISYYGFVLAINPKSKLEIIPAIIYLIALIISAMGYGDFTSPYYKTINPYIDCYSPISEEFYPIMVVSFFVYLISILVIWKYGKSLPPLSYVVISSLIIIGNIINVLLLFQLSDHEVIHNNCNGIISLKMAPIGGLIISVLLFIKSFKESFNELKERQYKNDFLNNLNGFLYYTDILPIWIFVFVLPISILILFVLVLFGQEPDSFTKVFTDTTTWRFSQQSHPPVIDRDGGHYLCTVAAKGNPKIVKPIYIGERRCKPIIVNRQLQIANAFEEMIQRFTPRIHKIIRKVYDNYGYNLSTKINNEKMSNITYILMKPLEYFFLICLYLFWKNPEKLISKQYKNNKKIVITYN